MESDGRAVRRDSEQDERAKRDGRAESQVSLELGWTVARAVGLHGGVEPVAHAASAHAARASLTSWIESARSRPGRRSSTKRAKAAHATTTGPEALETAAGASPDAHKAEAAIASPGSSVVQTWKAPRRCASFAASVL
eukprot:2465855-Prymnesium_polylepis.2